MFFFFGANINDRTRHQYWDFLVQYWSRFCNIFFKKILFLQMKTYQNDQINKQTDQMYNLLGMCLVLHPQRIDESLHSMLKEKSYAEKMNKMQAGDLAEFEACFTFACPKFLSPVPPSIEGNSADSTGMVHKEPLRLQLKVFLNSLFWAPSYHMIHL